MNEHPCPLPPTTYLKHAQKWGNGCGHQMCAGARHVVLARGTVPCDVVFVGEAPGTSENSSGLPFWGPAGKLFDEILLRSFMVGNASGVAFQQDGSPNYALCNLVGCIPFVAGRKASEPDDDQVIQCSPRLVEFLEMCAPRLIVTVGRLAEAWLDPLQRHGIKLPVSMHSVRMVSIPHPSAILQAPTIAQRRMQQHCVVVISNAVSDLMRTEVFGHGKATTAP